MSERRPAASTATHPTTAARTSNTTPTTTTTTNPRTSNTTTQQPHTQPWPALRENREDLETQEESARKVWDEILKEPEGEKQTIKALKGYELDFRDLGTPS